MVECGNFRMALHIGLTDKEEYVKWLFCHTA